MSDEPVSVLAKIIARGSAANTRKGAAINAVSVGIILSSLYLATSATEPNFLTDGLVASFQLAVYYATASLIAMAYLVVRQPFVTPEVRHPKCHFCDGTMTTTRLKCENCSSKSDKNE